MERTVAQIAARRAHPVWVFVDLFDVLPVAHVQAIATEDSMERLAFRAAGAFSKSLLPALMAGLTTDFVINTIAIVVIAIHKENPVVSSVFGR